MQGKFRREAQQIIEYLLLFVAVVVVLIVFIGPFGPFRGAVNRVIDISLNQVERETEALNIEE